MSRKRRKATKRLSSRTAWSFEFIEHEDLAPYLDASWLLAHVADAVLAHHVEAIRANKHPGTGASQPPLEPTGASGRAAERGLRPNVRGLARRDGRDLASLLTRTAIKARGNAKIGKGRVGTAARCEIKPGAPGHSRYLAKALAEHGVEHLEVTGEVEAVIDKAVSEWIDMVLMGPPQSLSQLPEFGPVQGRDLI